MFNRNNVDKGLLDAVNGSLQEGNLKRQAIDIVNEHYGVFNRNAVIHEDLQAYDEAVEAVFQELKEGKKEPVKLSREQEQDKRIPNSLASYRERIAKARKKAVGISEETQLDEYNITRPESLTPRQIPNVLRPIKDKSTTPRKKRTVHPWSMEEETSLNEIAKEVLNRYVQLDELHKDTLKSYIKKAAHEKPYKSIAAVSYDADAGDRRASKIRRNREKGIDRAVDRLTKEETQLDELSGFGAAFAAARKSQGAGGTFKFGGKTYSTNRADDKKMTATTSKPSVPTPPNRPSTIGTTKTTGPIKPLAGSTPNPDKTQDFSKGDNAPITPPTQSLSNRIGTALRGVSGSSTFGATAAAKNLTGGGSEPTSSTPVAKPSFDKTNTPLMATKDPSAVGMNPRSSANLVKTPLKEELSLDLGGKPVTVGGRRYKI